MLSITTIKRQWNCTFKVLKFIQNTGFYAQKTNIYIRQKKQKQSIPWLKRFKIHTTSTLKTFQHRKLSKEKQTFGMIVLLLLLLLLWRFLCTVMAILELSFCRPGWPYNQISVCLSETQNKIYLRIWNYTKYVLWEQET